ncbi:hypothetical protein [Streptomyces sp. TP-A0874]|uniref:hypothetical protein n=1 Tax=Streptomyces sp. TP-A0874 TaxID=549819 RepID=UPI000AE240DC|nr:hypothetical protein [Streptomyces sp. TP-A0874]
MDGEFREAGGDPACWLDQVCEECGRIREGGADGWCPECDGPPAGEAAGGAGGGRTGT